MTYVLESFVRDPSVRAALRKALSDDGRLSYAEVVQIVESTFDGKGVTYREFRDIQAILTNAKTLDEPSKALLNWFLANYYHNYLANMDKKRMFDLPYGTDHIPLDTANQRRPGYVMDPVYLTIHSTDNPSLTAKNERGWLTNKTNTKQASFHLVVDATQAIECIPLNEVAWHAGDGPTGNGNRKSIGLEICESGDRAKTLENAISLAAKLLRDRGWDTTKLRRHNDWSGKNCPRILIDSGCRAQPGQTWEWYVEQVGKLLR